VRGFLMVSAGADFPTVHTEQSEGGERSRA